MSFSLLFSRKSGGLVVFAVVLICLCYLMYHRSTKAGEVEKRASFTRAERSFSSLGLPHSLLYHPIAEDSLWLEALTKEKQKQEWDANTLCIPYISLHPSLHALCMTVGRVVE